MMRPILKCIFAASLFLALPVGASSTLLGVLEEPQCKKESVRSVRVLFIKEAGKWRSLSTEGAASLPIKAKWIVAFDGRKIGTVDTVDLAAKKSFGWTYARDRLLSLPPDQAPPSIPNKKDKFSGWCDPPKERPLVVLSEDHASDPDQWKPRPADRAVVRRLFSKFRKQAGKAQVCPPNARAGIAFPYTEKDLEGSDAYADRKGRQLISLRLQGDLNRCDGPIDSSWDNHVFLLNPAITYLGAGLSLVDAGDYDGDGKSEMLFWFSGYNRDGYSLMSADLQQRSDYFWGYH